MPSQQPKTEPRV